MIFIKIIFNLEISINRLLVIRDHHLCTFLFLKINSSKIFSYYVTGRSGKFEIFTLSLTSSPAHKPRVPTTENVETYLLITI